MSPKDNNNPPITDLKAMEFCDLADKKSEIAVLMKLNKLKKTEKDNLKKSGEQYMNKLRNLTKRQKSQNRTKQKFWS